MRVQPPRRSGRCVRKALAGVVLLIATPIARVALTLVAFAVRKDRLYALISAVVLALLAYGLLGG